MQTGSGHLAKMAASCSGKEIETQIELIYGDNKTNCQNRLHAVAVLCCTNAAARDITAAKLCTSKPGIS